MEYVKGVMRTGVNALRVVRQYFWLRLVYLRQVVQQNFHQRAMGINFDIDNRFRPEESQRKRSLTINFVRSNGNGDELKGC